MHNITDVFQLCSAISTRDRPLVAKIVEQVIAGLPADTDRSAAYYTPPALLDMLLRHVNDR